MEGEMRKGRRGGVEAEERHKPEGKTSRERGIGFTSGPFKLGVSRTIIRLARVSRRGGERETKDKSRHSRPRLGEYGVQASADCPAGKEKIGRAHV